jgi:diacylglycerol kinase (CTP)
MSVTVQNHMTSGDLRPRSYIHVSRKLWHFFGVLFVMVVYHNVSRATSLELLAGFGGFIIGTDLLRQYWPALNGLVVRNFGRLMRDTEERGLTGSSYMVIGIFVTVAFFPAAVVKLALMFLAVADPLASYFGLRYGKDRIFGRKSLQGSLAAFFACTVISGAYFIAQDLMVERLLVVSVLSGLIGALAEVLPVWKLDDNFVIPVVSSGLLYLLFLLFGGF